MQAPTCWWVSWLKIMPRCQKNLDIYFESSCLASSASSTRQQDLINHDVMSANSSQKIPSDPPPHYSDTWSVSCKWVGITWESGGSKTSVLRHLWSCTFPIQKKKKKKDSKAKNCFFFFNFLFFLHDLKLKPQLSIVSNTLTHLWYVITAGSFQKCFASQQQYVYMRFKVGISLIAVNL